MNTEEDDSEYGPCPNCGQGIHVSQLGEVDGKVCCLYCHEGEMRRPLEYVCVMFPYPSGDGLHIGHVYNYAIVDSYCRYLRYMGREVFQPFGYDAFGLPAENYARKVGRDPKDVTYENIGKFREQMKTMNTEYEELLVTSDESYQECTKWLFTEMHKRGLAYKAMGDVNWCESCGTVLAREQVKEGKCDRCGNDVITKQLEQWYLKITDYKDRLIAGLDNVDYPEKTKKAQRAWLENLHDWCVSRQRKWGCPIPIEGETDTLDTFVDSSFYFIEYCKIKGMRPRPVDVYVGGPEHACMHLIYARFVTMFLHDIGYVDFEEPFRRVVHQGMILNDGEKMSKSRGNVVNPDQYDPRELRFYLMFLGHYFDGGSWSDQNIMGIRRFIRKWDGWMNEVLSPIGTETIDVDEFKRTIFAYTESFKFNKVVSSFMILLKENGLKKLDAETRERLQALLDIYMPKKDENENVHH